MSNFFPVKLPLGLIERVDAVRGDVPRTRWVAKAIETALGEVEEGSSDAPAPSRRPSAADFRKATQKT